MSRTPFSHQHLISVSHQTTAWPCMDQTVGQHIVFQRGCSPNWSHWLQMGNAHFICPQPISVFHSLCNQIHISVEQSVYEDGWRRVWGIECPPWKSQEGWIMHYYSMVRRKWMKIWICGTGGRGEIVNVRSHENWLGLCATDCPSLWSMYFKAVHCAVNKLTGLGNRLEDFKTRYCVCCCGPWWEFSKSLRVFHKGKHFKSDWGIWLKMSGQNQSLAKKSAGQKEDPLFTSQK